MNLTTRALGAIVVLVVAAGLWDTGGGGFSPGDDPDDGKRQVTLIAMSSEDDVYVDAQVWTRHGEIYDHRRSRESDPWHHEIVVDHGDTVDINLLAWAKGPRELGHKVSVTCRIVVDGGEKDRFTDEWVIDNVDFFTVHAACTWKG